MKKTPHCKKKEKISFKNVFFLALCGFCFGFWSLNFNLARQTDALFSSDQPDQVSDSIIRQKLDAIRLRKKIEKESEIIQPAKISAPLPTPVLIVESIPEPTIKPTIPSAVELEVLFSQFGQEYGVNPAVLRQICWCESKYNTNAVNGSYAGLFQFSQSAWISTRAAMNLDSNPDLRFNAEEAVRTAAFKISHGGIKSWPNCSANLNF